MLWVASFAHLKILGSRSMFIMWARLLAHWVEKVGPDELNIMCHLCAEWYCVRFVGHLRGHEVAVYELEGLYGIGKYMCWHGMVVVEWRDARGCFSWKWNYIAICEK